MTLGLDLGLGVVVVVVFQIRQWPVSKRQRRPKGNASNLQREAAKRHSILLVFITSTRHLVNYFTAVLPYAEQGINSVLPSGEQMIEQFDDRPIGLPLWSLVQGSNKTEDTRFREQNCCLCHDSLSRNLVFLLSKYLIIVAKSCRQLDVSSPFI